MTLVTTVSQSGTDPGRWQRIIIDIQDKAGAHLYQEMTPATAAPGWSIRWVSNDEVLVEGADIGKFHVRRGAGGFWTGEAEEK